MLKLILVDDEAVIRKGIRTSINWRKYDVEIAAEASNGKDALDKVLDLKPEIVITDIRMPVMDGLALSCNIKKALPDTKIIILSGYEDFSYAREALSLGVAEYLLKPVGVEELTSLITKIRGEIINEQLKKERSVHNNMIFNENLPHIKSNFIAKLLKSEYPPDNNVFEQAEILNFHLSGPQYMVFVVDIDDFPVLTDNLSDADKELMKFSVMNVAEELLLASTTGLVCYSELEHLIGIISSENISEALVKNLCIDIQRSIDKYLKLSVSMGIGNVHKNIKDISKSYSEAVIALKNKIFSGKSSINIYNSDKFEKRTASPVPYPYSEEKDLINYLKALNTEGIGQTLSSLFGRFAHSGTAPESIKNICSRLIVTTVNCVEETGINIENSLGSNFNPFREIDKLDILDNLHMWLLDFFNKMLGLIQQNKTMKYKSIIKSVLQYVEENYQKDISLSEMASIVYVTPNYLSRIFKEEMNINFIDWLNQLRIEKAKALLLEAGSKTYEVAHKVGYGDYKYFSYIFKKITGCTPKEYKETKI